MPTKIFTTDEFRALDKSLWTDKLYREWCRRKGHIKRIPKVASVRTAMMRPGEARRLRKQMEKDGKNLMRAYDLEWQEVCQRLPYLFGSYNSKLDPNKVYVDEDFLSMMEVHSRGTRRQGTTLPRSDPSFELPVVSTTRPGTR